MVIAADQVTKSLAIAHLARGPVHVIGPFSFALAFNTGVAFSLGSGLGVPIVLVVLVLIAMIIWLSRGAPSYPGAIALGLVLGGALGNLSDRLFRANGGAVVDFIHTGFWPTFNVADASIVCGCAGFFLILSKRSGRRGRRVGRAAVSHDVDRASS